MAVANNMDELEKMLYKQMKNAAQKTRTKSNKIMDEELAGFYSGTQPKMYERTETMRHTNKVTDIDESGNSVSFVAYLDDQHVYETGKKPTMNDVLHLANEGKTNSSVGKLRKAVGNPGFWDKSKEKIKEAFYAEMGKKFQKL